MDIVRFDWDSDQDSENISKHGVPFVEAQLAFADERCIVVEGTLHSDKEGLLLHRPR